MISTDICVMVYSLSNHYYIMVYFSYICYVNLSVLTIVWNFKPSGVHYLVNVKAFHFSAYLLLNVFYICIHVRVIMISMIYQLMVQDIPKWFRNNQTKYNLMFYVDAFQLIILYYVLLFWSKIIIISSTELIFWEYEI